jgi:hypothetical protein
MYPLALINIYINATSGHKRYDFQVNNKSKTKPYQMYPLLFINNSKASELMENVIGIVSKTNIPFSGKFDLIYMLFHTDL